MKKLLILFYSINILASVSPTNTDEKSNQWEILVTDPTTSTVDQRSFFEIPRNILSLYKDSEREIAIGTHDWVTPYFSAWAHRDEEVYTVNFWGGLARIPGMNKRAFALIACHEFGHILGGEPRIKIADHSHMSAEGQSDYFATACLKNYLLHFKIEENIELNPYVASLCHERFLKNEIEKDLCLQVADGAKATSTALAFMANEVNPEFDTPSPDIVEETMFNSYPSVQCRMDTFLAGALAPYFATQDAKEHRPACWFKKEAL